MLPRLLGLPPQQAFPLSFMYGEIDWMEYKPGHAVVADWKARGIHAEACTVPGASHQVMLDAHADFTRMAIELDDLARAAGLARLKSL